MSDYPLRLLVYGQPGVGKTTLIASGVGDPRLTPGLLLDFEGGTLAVRSKAHPITLEQLQDAKYKPPPDRMDVLSIRSWAELEAAYDHLDEDKHPYQMVGVDSLTEVNYLCLQTIIGESVRDNPRHEPDAAEMRDYLKASNRMKTLVRGLRDLDTHCVISCGLAEDTNPRTKLPQSRPSLVGKLVFEVAGLMDIVGFLCTEEGEDPDTHEALLARLLVTDPSDREVAKDRSEGGMLGGVVDDPTLPKILDLLQYAMPEAPVQAAKPKPKPKEAKS